MNWYKGKPEDKAISLIAITMCAVALGFGLAVLIIAIIKGGS